MLKNLRLKAVDDDDLRVMSACLQDALVLVGDIGFRPEERRVLIAVNRFLWEDNAERERTSSVLTLDDVDAVKYRAIDRNQKDGILSLLTLNRVENGVELIFSGDAAIRVITPTLALFLQDIGETWPTLWQPSHNLAG